MNYRLYNDYELIYMVRENDETSRDILYEKYKPIIMGLVSESYNKFSKYGYEFDDFLQEAYISFQKALRFYDESKSCLFYTFAVMCIKRGLLSFCRRISCEKRSLSSYNMIDIDKLSIVDNNVNISDIVLYGEFENRIKELMLNLSFDISNVFELRINGFTYLEISSLLDIPLSTVNSRCKKVKEKLDLLICDYYCEKTN